MDAVEGEVCVPNIGPRERAKRMRIGMVAGAITVAATVGLVALRAPRFTRAVVFVPALMAAYGYFQAREKT